MVKSCRFVVVARSLVPLSVIVAAYVCKYLPTFIPVLPLKQRVVAAAAAAEVEWCNVWRRRSLIAKQLNVLCTHSTFVPISNRSIDRCAASALSPLCFSVLMAPKTSTSFRCILFFVQTLIEQKIELKVIILFGTCIPTININTHEPMCLFSIRSPGQQRSSRRSSFPPPPSRFTDILVSWGGGRTVENLPHQRIIRIERTRIRRRGGIIVAALFLPSWSSSRARY